MLSEGDASDMMAETCREAVSGDGDIQIEYYPFPSDQECRRAYEKNRYRYTTMPAYIETNKQNTASEMLAERTVTILTVPFFRP